MDLLNDKINTLLAITGKLADNPVAPFCYDSTALGSADDVGTPDGVASYNVASHQNIPLAIASILKVNDTVLTKGYRSKASAITRMLLNHFFGRTSFNLNKLIAQLNSFFTFLKGSIVNPETTYGFASLDADGRVPYSQLPESAMEYEGNWNADTNTPTLVNGTGVNGEFYVVETGGTQNLGDSYTAVTPSGNENPQEEGWYVYDGNTYTATTDTAVDPDTTYYEKHTGTSITFLPNDRVIFNGKTKQWEKLSGGAVRTVNNIAPDSNTGNVSITCIACSNQSEKLYKDSCNYLEMKQGCVDGKVNNVGITFEENILRVTNVADVTEGGAERMCTIILGKCNALDCITSPDSATDYGIILGFNSCADCVNDIVLGVCNCAMNGNNIALGTSITAVGSSITIGNTVTNSGSANIVLGNTTTVTCSDNIVIGNDTCSCNKCNIIIGSKSCLTNSCSLIIGRESKSVSSCTISIGSNTCIEGTYSSNVIVLGNSAHSGDKTGNTILIGELSYAGNLSAESIGIGYKAVVRGDNSISIGCCATVGFQASCAIAIGKGASVTQDDSIAIGCGATTTCQGDIAIGSQAKTDAYARIVMRTKRFAEVHLYVNCSNCTSVSGATIINGLKSVLSNINSAYGTSACTFRFYGGLHYKAGPGGLFTNYLRWNANTMTLSVFGSFDGGSSGSSAICGCSGCAYNYPHLIGTLFVPIDTSDALNNDTY